MPSRRDTIAGAAALGLGALGARALGSDIATTTANAEQPGDDAEASTLVVVWSSGDPDVAHRVCLMYTHAAKRNSWFDEVRLIVWGPSQRILIGDKDLKAKIAQMREDGVDVEACIACANTFGLADDLRALGLPVRGMGALLTGALKDPGVAVITF